MNDAPVIDMPSEMEERLQEHMEGLAKEKAEEIKQECMDEVDRIDFHLMRYFGFWAGVYDSCEVRISTQVPTAGITPSGILLINPMYFLKLKTAQKIFLLAHEVGHPAFCHFSRQGSRDQWLHNVAGDFVINSHLVPEIYKKLSKKHSLSRDDCFIDGGCFSEGASELTSEEIYEMITQVESTSPDPTAFGKRLAAQNPEVMNDIEEWFEKHAENQGKCPQCGKPMGSPQNGQGSGQGDGSESDSDSNSGDDASESDGSEEQSGSSHSHGEDGDTCSCGNSFGDMVSDELAEGAPVVRERKNEKKGKDWDEISRRAKQSAKSRGNLPAGLEVALDKLLEPRVNWATELQHLGSRLLSDPGMDEYDRTRVHRRTFAMPGWRGSQEAALLPGFTDTRPVLAVGIDTSGSMSCLLENAKNGECYRDLAFSEIEHLREELGARLWIAGCDAQVSGGEWIEPGEPIPTLKGGGGTDLVKVFEEIEEQGIDPSLLVMLTDGFTRHTSESPSYDVMWVTFGAKAETFPFGHVIEVNA